MAESNEYESRKQGHQNCRFIYNLSKFNIIMNYI